MSALALAFSNSVGRKYVMGLTGLFLVSFLFVHLGGNALLFIDDGGVAFNAFVRFMTTNPVIHVMEWVLFGGFILHIVYAAILTRQNNLARPDRYVFSGNKGKSSTWFSRNMGLTGTIVLAFLVIHIVMFWGRYKFGESMGTVSIEEAYTYSWKVMEDFTPEGLVLVKKGEYVDFEDLAQARLMNASETQVQGISMTEVVKASFSNPFISLFYVLAMGLLALHLSHGFQSAFRTLGLVHNKYTPLIQGAGYVIAIVVPFIFAMMPVVYFFFRH
ncbi:MAG: succinate dehydrogenase/fumarate reductase cytochrome b subunit [Bacteroidia bacterium]